MTKHIQRRCERCNCQYNIPLVRESKAKEDLLMFYPCTNCGYIFGFGKIINDSMGLCLDCSIPFCISKHHAKGLCKRCYIHRLRETLQNQPNVVNL